MKHSIDVTFCVELAWQRSPVVLPAAASELPIEPRAGELAAPSGFTGSKSITSTTWSTTATRSPPLRREEPCS